MNKEELKNQIITLLKDIFDFGFHYDEVTNQFICEYDDYDDYADIYVDKEGIDLSIGCKDGYDNGYSYMRKVSLSDLTKLTKCLKEFYK